MEICLACLKYQKLRKTLKFWPRDAKIFTLTEKCDFSGLNTD